MKNNQSNFLENLGNFIGRSRYVVLVAVLAVMLVSMSLFLLGTIGAAKLIYQSWLEFFYQGEAGSTEQIVDSLSIIGVMLRAVVFYLIGVGLFSLFIAPLNLTAALGIESLNDLETKVVSVVVVILAISFLQHFVQWTNPVETAYFGVTVAVVISALVIFQWNSRRAKEFEKSNAPDVTKRAQKEMFEENKEQRTVEKDEIKEGENSKSE